MVDPVVVGVDGSVESAAALEWAVRDATLRDAPLLVVHALYLPMVAVPFGPAMTLPPTEDLEKYGDALLVEAARRALELAPSLVVRTTMPLRPPSEALLRESEHATAVVVGTRGLGSISAAFLGSVSTRVSSHARCPTVVVPAASVADPAAPILVGIDTAPDARGAVRFALAEAARRGVDIVALHAYAAPMRALAVMDPNFVSADDRLAKRAAEEMVAETVDALRDDHTRHVNVEVRAVDAFAPEALIDAGRTASMTVVGSRGRGGFAGMLLGSVSQSVLHAAQRPVAVVHAA